MRQVLIKLCHNSCKCEDKKKKKSASLELALKKCLHIAAAVKWYVNQCIQLSVASGDIVMKTEMVRAFYLPGSYLH